jgi:hypothetical protein
MFDYAEIVKELRQGASTSRDLYLADAIEELLTLKVLADAKIERLESANTKKKRPPKRLPCTCGRKRLELCWWSSDPSEIGWFLRCPNCGRKSQPERYKSHVNSAWNDGLPEPPKEE